MSTLLTAMVSQECDTPAGGDLRAVSGELGCIGSIRAGIRFGHQAAGETAGAGCAQIQSTAKARADARNDSLVTGGTLCLYQKITAVLSGAYEWPVLCCH